MTSAGHSSVGTAALALLDMDLSTIYTLLKPLKFDLLFSDGQCLLKILVFFVLISFVYSKHNQWFLGVTQIISLFS